MKIDFVAVITTAWHLIGLKSYLLELQKQKKESISGLVYIEPHPKNGKLIDESLLLMNEYIVLKYIDDLGKIYKCIEKQFECTDGLRIISANFPNIKMWMSVWPSQKKAARCVVIDEGVGCYDKSLIRWVKSNYIDTHSIASCIGYIVKTTKDALLRRMENIQIEYFTLFNYRGKHLTKNNKVCRCYSNYLEFEYADKEQCYVTDRPYVILFTNPLEEEGNVLGRNLSEVYSKLRKLLNSNGYELYLRLHPRETKIEKYSDYNTISFDADSSEALLAKLKNKPSFVIGAHSTSLITAKLFYNITSITIGKILYPLCETSYCQDLIKKYNKNFESMVIIPNSFEELELILKSSLKNN